NDQDEAPIQLEKSTSISQKENHRSEKKVVNKEDNAREDNKETSQDAREEPEANQMKGVGEGIKEV
ncbi:hypothetical protein HAX54_007352, partial [Datura stramonium]|nr:hypothetical protein [Datura stramonium]